ncbi:MAG: gamma-glutamylcyclotransferase [Gammaproteobacteria bacterium]|nr:gamma-glutamylcyclotransferase [Gammaproteobacteria bacterium]
MNVWVFGYGSLIWRPDFKFLERRQARVRGWQRRFWQGSHDHRGVPKQPGRVVTLVSERSGHCDGMAYLLDSEVAHQTFEVLDHREKNGYERIDVCIEFSTTEHVDGVVYIAPTDNHAFLGPTSIEDMAGQIRKCEGPSGKNVDYLFELAAALRALDAEDTHVFELEAAVRIGLDR